jgi:hypothetical protein
MATIYKRPGSKTYTVIYDVTDEKGDRKQVWEGGKSYNEARSRKREIENQQENGTFAEPSKVTVAEYLEQWLAYYKKKGNAFSTCTMVEGCLRNHVIPNFGEHKLQELTSKEIEEFFLSLKKQRHLQNNYRYTMWDESELPYLSQNTIRHIYVYFNMALEKAVEWKLLSVNPLIMAPPENEKERPRHLHDRTAQRRTVEAQAACEQA